MSVPRPPLSLLLAGVLPRLVGALALSAGLWAAYFWVTWPVGAA